MRNMFALSIVLLSLTANMAYSREDRSVTALNLLGGDLILKRDMGIMANVNHVRIGKNCAVKLVNSSSLPRTIKVSQKRLKIISTSRVADRNPDWCKATYKFGLDSKVFDSITCEVNMVNYCRILSINKFAKRISENFLVFLPESEIIESN